MADLEASSSISIEKVSVLDEHIGDFAFVNRHGRLVLSWFLFHVTQLR
jgi:hypothetical protein